MRAGWRVRVRARARGPGPGRPRPRRGVQGERRGGDPTAARGPPRRCRGFYTPEGRADATWPARPQRAHDAWGVATASAALLLFHLSVFAKAKLEKVTTNLKISKNKSCRGSIDLQLSQRATYVLINGLSGNVGRSCSFSTARLLFTARSTRFLANLHSKLECSPIMKNVFLEITNNFRIGLFRTSILKFGERARKPNQPF
jgi:hypothetical protein